MSQSLTALYLQNPELANALRKREAGQAMMQQGMDSSPVQHWSQGVSRLAQALIGGYEANKADREFKEYGEKSDAELKAFSERARGGGMGAALMQADQPPAAPAMPAAAAPRMPPMGSPELMGMVAPVAQRYGVPLSLAMALVQQESGGNPGAVGDGGQSVGLGQIQARTATNPGYGVAPMDPAQRTNPEANLDFAMRYLVGKGRHMGATDLNDPAHQDIALRAYNGGGDPNYVQNVRGRMGSDAMPVAGPGVGQGAPQGQPSPMVGSRDLAEAQRLAALAQEASTSRNPNIRAQAPMLMQQAQMAQTAALQRQPQPSETERLALAAGLQPGTPQYQQAMQAALDRKGGPLVSIDQRGESSFEQKRAATMAERVQGWEDANVKSAQTLNRLTQMERALDQFSTGAMSGAMLKAGQIAQRLNVPPATLEALGINPEQVASGEAIRSLASQMLVGMIGSGGFPAQGFSNADREMLERALPGLQNSPGGNKMIIQIMRAGAQRDMEIGKAWRDWSRTKGDNLASVRGFQSEILPGITERGIVSPILEQGGWTDPASGPGGAAQQPGAPADGATATNPQTGERLVFRNGQWGAAR